MNEVKHGRFWTVFFALLCVAYLFPIALVVVNSFKGKVYIASEPFALPNAETFVGLDNYVRGIELSGFLEAFVWSLVITVGATALILLGTSMTAWWIVRVNNGFAKSLLGAFLLNLVVPFQMVMFTLAWVTDRLGLSNPFGLWVIYLGFGAGLAVFIFTGFVKGIPIELDEAALIDGCGPVRTFFQVILPVMKPSLITVAILEVMWLWNDYLLPYLSMDIKKYKTIPIAVQYLKGGYGSVDMGAMMGVLVLAMIPVVAFYLLSQKHIIKGVVAGAVKG
ncbi:MAG: carbohydrate ABC transporter permease [Actinobacteria bacterium]|nr:carbohydrate ABC transporter permease [Actinomycetota bacterium]